MLIMRLVCRMFYHGKDFRSSGNLCQERDEIFRGDVRLDHSMAYPSTPESKEPVRIPRRSSNTGFTREHRLTLVFMALPRPSPSEP
ncbi:MAG: hypothetical protein D6736_10510 [Nitrospinota bacterium]|nr:MAG: hypothetical protein D6736_10510 [Nitrospinota bacterium]